ncbi:DUF6057 family protein [Bacteroides sp. OttesenSCG-928-N06]|nr:DUF6057 family protein [Bacteroides sp. OttesenSCG-928-N06]
MNKLSFILFLLLAFLLYEVGYYNFSYVEHWNTFIYNTNITGSLLLQPGGCAQLLAGLLVQFFVHPLAGILITAFVLTGIARLTADVLWCCTKNAPILMFSLALFPVVGLVFLHYNANYMYAGTIALLLMLVFLRLSFLFGRFGTRLGYSLLSGILLYILAGPIAMLYGLLLLIVEAYRGKWQSLGFILVPLVVYLAGAMSLLLGFSGEWRHVLLPDGYFTLRLQAGSVIYLPWLLMLSVFVVGGLFKWIVFAKRWTQGVSAGIVMAGAVAFALVGAPKYIERNNEIFKELNYYANRSEWKRIIDRCNQLPMDNLLFQNYLNLALAEEGILADQLFWEPCVDIRTIYVTGNKTPYISALLSDVFFSMGHISFAQRYAFEANESVGNFSPRLLQRLVLTNIIYGQYGVARKYLNLLGQTLFYKDWAMHHQRFLWNDEAVEADPLLGVKRRCLFPDNRFAGTKGLDDDLKQIILQNPGHKATVQYLGSLYLLSKDIPRFKSTLETFYGTEALPVLPIGFQEGVLVFANGDKAVVEHYHIEAATLQRFEAYKEKSAKDKRNLWHFLKYKP